MQLLKKLAPDLFLVSGAAILSYGAYSVWPPLGYVVAGALMIYAGLRLA